MANEGDLITFAQDHETREMAAIVDAVLRESRATSLLAQCLPEHDVNGPGSAADGLLSRGGTAARGAVGP